MEIVEQNLNFLKALANIKSINKQKQLLKKANSNEILAILEICVNILKSRVPLTQKQKLKLSKHATFLRKLGRTRTEKSVRKVLQTGEGGVFPALLLPILAFLLKNGV